MTTPDGQLQPEEARPEPAQAATGPTVTTAPPPRARRGWSRVPSHVGPARTSTIVLAVLFVGIFALYLLVRPVAPATAGSTGTTSGTTQPADQAPARTTTPPPTRTTTPTRTSSPTPTQTTTATPTTTSPPPGTVRAPGRTSGSSTSLPTLSTSGSAPTS